MRCDISGYPTQVGIWMRDFPEETDNMDFGDFYNQDYYKEHVTIEGEVENSEVNYYVSPDGRNQTVSATVYLPSEVIKNKVFVCVAYSNMSYPDIQTLYMPWQ